MGNEPGRLTSKHLDTNHIFQNHTEINPKNTISLSNYSAVTSQKSLPSQFSRKVFYKKLNKKS